MIAADARLRDELALCHHHGIGHSTFLGWPERDQDKALAYQEWERSICGGCGTRRAEWDPAKGGDHGAYRAAVDICPGCQVRGDLEHDLRDGESRRSGEQVVLLPRAVVEAQEAERAALRKAREGAAR